MRVPVAQVELKIAIFVPSGAKWFEYDLTESARKMELNVELIPKSMERLELIKMIWETPVLDCFVDIRFIHLVGVLSAFVFDAFVVSLVPLIVNLEFNNFTRTVASLTLVPYALITVSPSFSICSPLTTF